MRRFGLLTSLFAAVFVLTGTGGAGADLSNPNPHPHELKKRGVHWQSGAQPGEPGPAPARSQRARSTRIEVLDHDDPGGGAPGR